MIHIESFSQIIQQAVNDSFNSHKINNHELQSAISEAILNILTDRSIIEGLTTEITEIQDFNKRRRELFRG